MCSSRDFHRDIFTNFQDNETNNIGCNTIEDDIWVHACNLNHIIACEFSLRQVSLKRARSEVMQMCLKLATIL